MNAASLNTAFVLILVLHGQTVVRQGP